MKIEKTKFMDRVGIVLKHPSESGAPNYIGRSIMIFPKEVDVVRVQQSIEADWKVFVLRNNGSRSVQTTGTCDSIYPLRGKGEFTVSDSELIEPLLEGGLINPDWANAKSEAVFDYEYTPCEYYIGQMSDGRPMVLTPKRF